MRKESPTSCSFLQSRSDLCAIGILRALCLLGLADQVLFTPLHSFRIWPRETKHHFCGRVRIERRDCEEDPEREE